MPRKTLASLFLLTCLLASTLQAAVEVRDVRLWSGPDSTRIVLDLSQPVEHRLFTLQNPSRVVIDLSAARLVMPLADLPAGAGAIRSVRGANRSDGAARLVLDLDAMTNARSFLVPPKGRYGHRLIVELDAQRRPVQRPTVRADEGSRDLVIAVDAGHGGEDPGAVGRKGTYEKDVVLAIARRLAGHIDREPGMRAALTRNGDYFLSLQQRVERAREHGADLFISIHADAFNNPKARGSSVYVLSPKGATDEAARWLAARENAADLVGGVSLDDKDDLLASVLLDLSQNASIGASLDAGDFVLNRLGAVNRLHKSTVQQAGFVVLKAPDIPSILVETAFISHHEEETLLRQPAYQEKVATALMSGLREYFYANPPPGTWVAQHRARGGMPREIVIARGDTLSGIASQYNVSVPVLRRHNNLKNDKIRVGQVIAIPGG
ncbi:N-acetylmuramoyl-L-alanine amidase [Wenzhouxiangella sp. XN24]|uniref:N-acetylmuramoyl-L-alanine amidase n=1 Tax=Wenzhouxiangella sp. XN24 TaxID=2713569 RepID=UPI0013E9C064|nr:N-acetylmuramoyl-L-alanine amidase [Wenzhouxiangella sp. XN24]NGX15501.1 AMIN domain-containing protein [Wenzhouxiangella sp. XN24]